jgi:flagellar export protein FliJ
MASSPKVDDFIINEMAAKELRIATENYAEAEKSLKKAQFECDRLRQFRQDYVDRFNNEIKFYVNDETHHGFRSFFSRLDLVIFEQQEIVENLRCELSIQRQLWQESQRKLNTLALQEIENQQLLFAN